ncbi:GNAT family N-acetyltransferase [Candidatus Aenigmatarchaeota archaeon]
MRLVGKRIILRLPKISDARSITKHANNKAIYRYTTRIPYPYQVNHARAFIKDIKNKMRKNQNLSFVIEFKGDVIGMISLDKIEKQHMRAELGFWLGKEYWKHGFVSESLLLILDHGFNNLKLHRIYAKVFKPNKASSKLLKRAGFKKEGLMRKNFSKDGKYLDTVLYSMLKNEFRKKLIH